MRGRRHKEQETSFWAWAYRLSAILNIVLAGCFIAYFGRWHLVQEGEIKYVDLVVIVLASLTALLAALAIVIGGLAIWGYAEIKKSADALARSVAADVARLVAAPTAAREAIEIPPDLRGEAKTSSTEDSSSGLDPMVKALTD